MLHFAIGTKAQFIKMAPIMYLLEKRGQKYHVLDLSQHASLTGRILLDFGLDPIITRLGSHTTSVTTYGQAIKWFSSGMWRALVNKKRLRRNLFSDEDGVALLHGDTLSTLLGFYLARSAGLRTALVEAGLSSGSLFDPFPEESIRRYTARRVNYLFPPDSKSESWLRQQVPDSQIACTGYNTVRDSLSIILREHAHRLDPEGTRASAVATLHRLETLSNPHRLARAVNHIMAIAKALGPIAFYMHEPTQNALKRGGHFELLVQEPAISITGLAPYSDFVRTLANARFVLTDGGSVQEEAACLNRPCIILRNRTERDDGIGRNAFLSTWSVEQDVSRLLKITAIANASADLSPSMDASRIIIERLEEWEKQRTG